MAGAAAVAGVKMKEAGSGETVKVRAHGGSLACPHAHREEQGSTGILRANSQNDTGPR